MPIASTYAAGMSCAEAWVVLHKIFCIYFLIELHKFLPIIMLRAENNYGVHIVCYSIYVYVPRVNGFFGNILGYFVARNLLLHVKL